MKKFLNDNMAWMILIVLLIVGGVFVYGIAQAKKNKNPKNNTNTPAKTTGSDSSSEDAEDGE